MNYQARTVNELMRVNPLKCDPGISVLEASKLMCQQGHGSLLVVENSLPIGIVTERDILSKVVAEGKSPSKLKISKIMTSPVITISPNADITEAARLMVKKKIRRLAIVSDNMLMGSLSDSDILVASSELIASSEDIKNLVCLDMEPGSAGPGYCEECKTYSTSLWSVNGVFMCGECRDRS